MKANVPSRFTAARWQLQQSLLFALLRRRPDDRFIVSFPRSGSTWLRTIVTNVLLPEANSNPDIFNAVIPGISLRNVFAVDRMASPRLLKTHCNWRPAIGQTVYLVRDGRDAIISLFHYLVTRRQKDLTFARFYARYRQGAFGTPWHGNVESWLTEGRESLGDNLLVVPFADMKSDTANIVNHVLHFLGIEATEQELADAISKAGLDRMRQIERSRRGDVGSSDASFYRGGITGQWEHYFTPEIMQDFLRFEAGALQLAGYSK